MRTLLIAGNSHIGGLYGSNKAYLTSLGYDKIQIAMQNITATGFDPTKSDFFIDFKIDRFNKLYQDQLSQGTDLSDFFQDISLSQSDTIDVLLVGLKLHGESVHEMWGSWTNARLPYLSGLKINNISLEPPGPITDTLARTIYSAYYRKLARFLEKLLPLPHVNVIAWLASPRPAEKSARFAYGEEAVNSGLLEKHYRIDREELSKAFAASSLSQYIHVPNDYHVSELGLTPDEFFISERENHVLGNFYRRSLRSIFQASPKMPI
jgi:hypothetical protein